MLIRTHVTEILIMYAVQKITNTKIVPARVDVNRRLPDWVAQYLIDNRIWNGLDVPSRKEKRFASGLQNYDAEEVCGALSENIKVAADVLRRFETVKEVLLYVTILYLENNSSVFKDNVWYKQLNNWKKVVIYRPQSLRLPVSFKFLTVSLTVVLRIINPVRHNRAVIELHEQWQVVES